MGRLRPGGISVRTGRTAADFVRKDLYPNVVLREDRRNSACHAVSGNQPISTGRGLCRVAIRELAVQFRPADHVGWPNRGRSDAIEHQLSSHPHAPDSPDNAAHSALDVENLWTCVD